MGDTLQFILELQDKMSATADKMSSALEKVQKKSHDAGKESDDFFAKVSHANKDLKDQFLEGIAEKFAVFELAKEGVAVIGELVEKAAELGVELAKSAIEAGLFEQKTLIAFKGLTGSAGQAHDVMEEVKGFANQFGESYDRIAKIFGKGLLGGLKATEGDLSISKISQFALDVEKMMGPPAEATIATFAQMNQQGKVMGRQVAMTFEQMGIPLEALAKKLGMSGVNLKELRGTMFDADRVMKAVLSTFGDLHGKVGQTTEDMGKTLPGQIQKLRNTWDDLLGRVAESGALDRLSEIIGKVATAMDPATESGKRWGVMLDHLFDSVEKLLAPLASDEGMRRFTDGLYQFGSAVAAITDLVIKVIPPITKLAELWLDTGIGSLMDVFALNAKIGTAAEHVKSAFVGTGASQSVSLPPGVDINTLGWDEQAKLASAHFASGGHVDGPTLAWIGEGGEGESVIPDSKMSGGLHAPITQTINIHPEASVSHQELGTLIHRLGLGELQGALDTLAQQMGVSH